VPRDFYWVDDNLDNGSVAALEAAGKSSRLVVASSDPWLDDLERVRRRLEKAAFKRRALAKLKAFMKEVNSGGVLSL